MNLEIPLENVFFYVRETIIIKLLFCVTGKIVSTHRVLLGSRGPHGFFLYGKAKTDLAPNLPAALAGKSKLHLLANPASYAGYLSSRTSSLIYLP